MSGTDLAPGLPGWLRSSESGNATLGDTAALQTLLSAQRGMSRLDVSRPRARRGRIG
jgi:hypothetical protein